MNCKEELYRKVQKTREHLGIGEWYYPLPYLPTIIPLYTDIYVRETPLITPGLRGMTVSDPETGSLAMLLDLSSPKEVRHFAAAHELIHCEHHPIIRGATFKSYDTIGHMQNRFLEWEANEGAAEFIMPYQIFIPLFFAYVECHDGMIRHAVEDLAIFFRVNVAAIDYRIASLRYELWQYAFGIPIRQITVMSASLQKKKGIHVNGAIDSTYDLWNCFGRYYA